MQHTLEQSQTIQQYVFLIFDELTPVSSNRGTSNEQLISQINKYGRKIMQLSEQTTFKYRNQHYLPKNQVENKICQIYKLVSGEIPSGSYQQTIKSIIQRLQNQRKSIWMRYSLPQSRLILPSGQKSVQRERKPILQQQKNSIKVSRAKSKAGNRTSAVKQVLKLKGLFQSQQNLIRELYERVNKHLSAHKVSTSSFQPDSLKFSRNIDENNCQSLIDIVRCSTQNHSKHLSNICNIVQLLYDNLNKRLKNQGLANSKLQAYISEVTRMEEVYSYTLSKMLETLANLKHKIDKESSSCFPLLQTLQEITRKLYGLFPNSQSMLQLSGQINNLKEIRSYGVQANMTKITNERKIGSQTYRLQVKIFQLLDRFQKNMKFKKNVDPKQVEKLFQSVREIIPTAKNPTQQDLSYEQEFKKLIQLQEKRQIELNEAFSKKHKKHQKKMQQLEQIIEQHKRETAKLNQGWQQQKKKLQKKIDHQQHQYKKLATQKSHLQGNLSEMLKQIEGMREAVRRQSNEQTFRKIQIQKERDELCSKHECSMKELNKSMDQLKFQRDKIGQERSIYKQKIQLVQAQLQEQKELSTGLRVQLQNVYDQNSKYQSQVNEMRKLYEQKIRQVEEMIQNIHQLQIIKQNQSQNITRLSKKLQFTEKEVDSLSELVREYQKKLQEMKQEKIKLEEEMQHWKHEGKLTDSDLKLLRDQVQKVNSAYLQSQEVNDSLKKELKISLQEKQQLFKEKLKISRSIQEVQTQNIYLKNRLQAIQLSERDMKDDYYQKCQQGNSLNRQIDDLKKEIVRVRKEQSEDREEKSKIQKQLRQVRQESQSRRQLESSEQGKRRLQLENMRVQIRRKTEQLQKQKQSYQQRIGMLMQKMKDMEQCMGQKQLLSRLLQHQSQ